MFMSPRISLKPVCMQKRCTLKKNLSADAKVADVKIPDVGNGREHLDIVSILCRVVEEDSR